MIREIQSIITQIEKSDADLGRIELYVFGSATLPNSKPEDIDILVIYDCADQPKVIRKLLESLLYINLDLIFMTKEEEIETDFIRLQKCMLIYQGLFS